MKKYTTVAFDTKYEIVTIKGEQHLKMICTGISRKSLDSPTPYLEKNKTETIVLMPLYALPYDMKIKRQCIAKWKANMLEHIANIENSLIQPLPIEI